MTVDELARRRLELLMQELTVQLKVRRGVVPGTDYVEVVKQWGKAARSLVVA